MQQLNCYWQALWALTSGWGALPPPPFFSLFSVGFSKEIANLWCRQGRALLEVIVHSPNSPGFLFCVCIALLNPCPREPFRWIDFLLRCNIHYGSQYIMLSVCWKCRYAVTFEEYVCSQCGPGAKTDMRTCNNKLKWKKKPDLFSLCNYTVNSGFYKIEQIKVYDGLFQVVDTVMIEDMFVMAWVLKIKDSSKACVPLFSPESKSIFNWKLLMQHLLMQNDCSFDNQIWSRQEWLFFHY